MLIVTSATAATAAATVAAGDVDIVVVHLCFIIVGRIPMGHFTCRDAQARQSFARRRGLFHKIFINEKVYTYLNISKFFLNLNASM